MFSTIRSLGATYQTYWLGTLLMQMSTQIFLVLISWQLTSSTPTEDQSFLIYVLSNVPFVFLTFASARLCQHWTYRQTHILGQVLSGLAALLFGLYVFSGSVVCAFAAIFLWHSGIAIRGPAYQATMAGLFKGDDRDSAFAYHDIAVNLSKLVGPLVASWLIISNSAPLWLAIAYSSIAVTLVAIVSLDKSAERSTQGVSLLVKAPKVLSRLGLIFAISIIFVANQALLPALTRQTFGDVGALAALVTTWSIGAILGSLAQSRVRRLLGRWEASVLLLASAVNMLTLAIFHQLALCMVTSCLGGAASVVLFLRLKTDYLLLRPTGESVPLLSSYFFATYLGFACGAAFWGTIAQNTSPAIVFGLVAAATAGLCLVFAVIAKNFRRTPGEIHI